MLLRRRSIFIVALQAALVAGALEAAWLLRFDFRCPHPEILTAAIPLLVLFRIAALSRYNLLHGYWRYTGASDAIDVAKAVGLGTVGFVVAERGILGIESFPRSIYISEAIISFVLLAGIRFSSRKLLSELIVGHNRSIGKRAIIVGAGHAAQLLIREMPSMGFHALGCVDDDRDKQGATVRGVRVVGHVEELASIVRAYSAEEVFIAVPSATREQMQRIVRKCIETDVRFRTVPRLEEILAGESVSAVKDICLDDLLGREPVRLDLEPLKVHLRGKRVAVTGAAGSIGSELCRQISAYGPAKLVCVDQAETPLFYIDGELSAAGAPVRSYVADVTNALAMRQIFREQHVEIIFHAAAYKHVPLMEQNVREAVRNNVLALDELADIAEGYGCEQFILISSDKAVSPTNVMGCTKRLGELLLAGRPNHGMSCTSVRFGNVLGSQGSVVPIFEKQIREGRIRVTHPEISRFFMTIPEAVSLVLQAATVGRHGEVLVLDMGEPIKIVDLARTLVRLHGITPDEVEIVFTGLRPGEKLFEELFYDFETRMATSNPKVNCARGISVDPKELNRQLRELAALVANGTETSIREKMREVVPSYTYVESKKAQAVEFTISPISLNTYPAGASASD